jgi:protein SCO1/2
MLDHSGNGRRRFRGASIFSACILGAATFVSAFVSAGCRSKPAESGPRFHLHGKIVSVNANNHSAEVDHDAIPGFMEAMTMFYPVPDPRALASLGPGDEITADVVVTEGVPHLENVVIVKKAPQPKPDPASGSNFHMPQPGDAVPDFALVDQNGKQIRLRSFRGDALLLTFIYTRCPFADFCPKASDQFAHMYAMLRKETGPASRIRLLSVSFDPAHDTPAALRTYAASFRDTTGTDRPFDRWEFASAPEKELPEIAKFFGLYYNAGQGQITHSISTSLISPDGKILVWFHDNNWKPSDLMADATKALTVQAP